MPCENFRMRSILSIWTRCAGCVCRRPPDVKEGAAGSHSWAARGARDARKEPFCKPGGLREPLHGFTLVELLVAIAIITLLISMLLPSLTKAHRAADQIKCASNMRQISLAVITYVQDNRGRLMPCLIYSMGAGKPYPDGFFWAAELVHQGYITAPYLPYANNIAYAPPNGTVFQCPEGIVPENSVTNGQLNSGQGSYPTDAKNNGWYYGIDDNPRLDGQVPYGIGTWYQLTSRLTGYSSNFTQGGAFNAPFVYFQQGTDKLGESEAADVADPNYARNLTQIQQSCLTVMIAEATDPNWVTQSAVVVNGVSHYASRLGARHGQRTLNGTNAYTNFAFFDGHVALFPTYPIDSNNGAGAPSGQPGCAATTAASGTIFTLFNQ
jgi:prepilin-type N-terminal cleavage/methylation domain-containing protein/prepilin-type processing-associated H-X9-DG protein